MNQKDSEDLVKQMGKLSEVDEVRNVAHNCLQKNGEPMVLGVLNEYA